MAACTLFRNYPATCLLFLTLLVIILLPVPTEEGELRERFGIEYEAYCTRVPRFIPRFSSPEQEPHDPEEG